MRTHGWTEFIYFRVSLDFYVLPRLALGCFCLINGPDDRDIARLLLALLLLDVALADVARLASEQHALELLLEPLHRLLLLDAVRRADLPTTTRKKMKKAR